MGTAFGMQSDLTFTYYSERKVTCQVLFVLVFVVKDFAISIYRLKRSHHRGLEYDSSVIVHIL